MRHQSHHHLTLEKAAELGGDGFGTAALEVMGRSKVYLFFGGLEQLLQY